MDLIPGPVWLEFERQVVNFVPLIALAALGLVLAESLLLAVLAGFVGRSQRTPPAALVLRLWSSGWD